MNRSPQKRQVRLNAAGPKMASPCAAKRRRIFYGAALPLLVVLLAGGLRFCNLGRAAFRADEGSFPEMCGNPNVTLATIFGDWFKVVGDPNANQLPFPVGVTKALIDLFHGPVTEFTCRVPAATFGTLAVLVAFFAGRVMLGRRLGIFLSLLLALNPAQIQCSMEAYYYPPMVLGSVLLLWSVAWCYRFRRMPVWPLKFYLAGWLGVVLCAYSHLSGWWLSALWGIVVTGVALYRFRSRQRALRELVFLFGGCLLLCLPIVVLPWGVTQFLKLAFPSAEEHAAMIRWAGMYAYPGNPLGFVTDFLWESGWGGNPARKVATVCFVGLATLGLARGRRKMACTWICLGVFVGGVAILHLASIANGNPPGTRYLLFVHSFFVAVLAVGMWAFPSNRLLRRWGGVQTRRWFALLAAAGAVFLLVYPAYASSRLKGKPTPYKEIQHWANTAVPPGTLILVDRWFEPWCELRQYNSTNAFFTFSVPSEPADVAFKMGWRKSVEAFFEKYPDALYMPLVNSYTWDPAYGPWQWPETFFRHRVVIATNEAGLLLGSWGGVGMRAGEYFATSSANRLRVPVYFNDRHDILQMAQEAGKRTVVLFAPGWGYTKLWRQIQGDFRDWRILQGAGMLDVYSLMGTATNVTVTVRGVSLNGGKNVQASTGASYRFRQGQIVDWSIQHVGLEPGKNQLTLRDAGPSNSVLLVERVSVER